MPSRIAASSVLRSSFEVVGDVGLSARRACKGTRAVAPPETNGGGRRRAARIARQLGRGARGAGDASSRSSAGRGWSGGGVSAARPPSLRARSIRKVAAAELARSRLDRPIDRGRAHRLGRRVESGFDRLSRRWEPRAIPEARAASRASAFGVGNRRLRSCREARQSRPQAVELALQLADRAALEAVGIGQNCPDRAGRVVAAIAEILRLARPDSPRASS